MNQGRKLREQWGSEYAKPILIVLTNLEHTFIHPASLCSFHPGAMSVPGCCLTSLGGCVLPLHELAEHVLVEICDRAGRTWEPIRDTRSRQSGACKTHHNMFVKTWGKARTERPIKRKPQCDVCLNAGRFKKKKRKSLDWTITWNRGHPQSQPLQAGPLVCDPCSKPVKQANQPSQIPTAASVVSKSVDHAGVDTNFVHCNDSGDLGDESDDGDSGGCMYTFFGDGCEPDTVTTRCCLIQCCDVCAAHTNWTTVRRTHLNVIASMTARSLASLALATFCIVAGGGDAQS